MGQGGRRATGGGVVNRRTFAVCLAPLPLVVLWGWRQPVDLLAWSLLALLIIASSAGLGLWGMCHTRLPQPVAHEPAPQRDEGLGQTLVSRREQDTPTPAQVLATVPGVDLGELLARVVRLEQQGTWVRQGVEEAETFANIPEPPADVVRFLEQLDRSDS